MSTISMPHEAIATLLRRSPETVIDLLRVTRVKLRAVTSAIVAPSTLVPRLPDARSDGLVLLKDARAKAVAAIVVEVRLGRDPEKRFVWPYYQARARLRHRVPCEVLVIAPDQRTATWARRRIDLGSRAAFRPLVIGPREITSKLRARAPELAVLHAMAHGEGHPDVVIDAAVALQRLPRKTRLLYFDEILVTLSNATRKAVLERWMSRERQLRFKTPELNELVDRMREEGREEGREDSSDARMRSFSGCGCDAP